MIGNKIQPIRRFLSIRRNSYSSLALKYFSYSFMGAIYIFFFVSQNFQNVHAHARRARAHIFSILQKRGNSYDFATIIPEMATVLATELVQGRKIHQRRLTSSVSVQRRQADTWHRCHGVPKRDVTQKT